MDVRFEQLKSFIKFAIFKQFIWELLLLPLLIMVFFAKRKSTERTEKIFISFIFTKSLIELCGFGSKRERESTFIHSIDYI